VPLVVRTWNLFHGNASPPERRAFLREMVELVTADRPDIVCLQEVPVWAFARLEAWSGMQAACAVGAPVRVRSSELGRRLTDLHHGVLRSALTGEGLAILTSSGGGATRVEPVGPRRVLLLQEVGEVTVGCFHVTGGVVAREQLARVVSLAGAGRAVLAGDANLLPPYDLVGFSEPLPDSIDQILVRGVPSSPPERWPEERRRVGGRLLSDHAPVELRLG